MSHSHGDRDDAAPGEADPGDAVGRETQAYAVGLAFAVLLTVASFWLAGTDFL